MRDPWARVRISIEQPGSVTAEDVFIAEVMIFPGENVGERVKESMDRWAQSLFRHSVQDSWDKR